MLAVLLKENYLNFNKNILPYFKDISWKDINQKNKNNYMKSVADFLEKIKNSEIKEKIKFECERIFSKLNELDLKILGEKVSPSQKY